MIEKHFSFHRYVYPFFMLFSGVTGQTPWRAGPLRHFERQFGRDGAKQPKAVRGPGNAAHASSRLGRAGDEALREGAGLPWGADWLTYQQLGPQRLWTLSLLRCEKPAYNSICFCCDIMVPVIQAANVAHVYNLPVRPMTNVAFLCMNCSSSRPCPPHRKPRSWAAPYSFTRGTCRQMGGWLSIGCPGWWVREME